MQDCLAQDLLSTYKPKTKTEKLVIAKLKALPEIKKHYNYKIKGGRPDILIDPPDTAAKYYRFQVGFSYPDIFRTYYWLSFDPKTLQVYYADFDDEGMQDITLQQWRYWRKRPEFDKPHKWVKGKLVVVEYKKHVPKKNKLLTH